MAEVGLIGTIVGVAGAGVKLSITLYTFSETVATAPAKVRDMARDVSLTSAVLEELGANLRQGDQATLYSGAAVQTATDVVAECECVFREMDGMVARAMESASRKGVKKGGKLALSARDRLQGPFMEPKMEVLKGNLDRLKSTLVLMLHVLTYARDLRVEKKTASQDDDDAYQRTLLENLLRANEEATRNYQHLLKTIGPDGETPAPGQAQTEGPDAANAQFPGALRESAAGGPFVAPPRDIPPGQNIDGSTPRGLLPQQPPLVSTIRGCLERIERALLQVDQASSLPGHSPRVGVHIELEKDFGSPRYAPGRPNPWVVLSIVRKDRRWPERASTPSKFEPDDLDMYASVAAGAIESISIEEEAPQYRNRPQMRIDEGAGVMRERINRVSRRPGPLPVLEGESEPLDPSIRVQRRSSGKPWYSSVWESLPSPTAALGSIQETVKNSGLFFGVDEESENPDTVLEYHKHGESGAGASQAANSAGPRIARSQTFDDILNAPPVKGPSTSPLPVTTTLESPKPDLESTDNSNTIPAPPEAAMDEEPAKHELPNPSATVARTEEPSKETADSSVEDTVGKQELAEQGEPDAVNQLLKQWTTLYDDQ
ncbi:hypothetical protein CLAIMM_09552 [Cladophialophora immunda]|nr:hypothetical protein CLAIMM_09552 [Cladophialophora immunda]